MNCTTCVTHLQAAVNSRLSALEQLTAQQPARASGAQTTADILELRIELRRWGGSHARPSGDMRMKKGATHIYAEGPRTHVPSLRASAGTHVPCPECKLLFLRLMDA